MKTILLSLGIACCAAGICWFADAGMKRYAWRNARDGSPAFYQKRRLRVRKSFLLGLAFAVPGIALLILAMN